jgi:hypothetical protein
MVEETAKGSPMPDALRKSMEFEVAYFRAGGLLAPESIPRGARRPASAISATTSCWSKLGCRRPKRCR